MKAHLTARQIMNRLDEFLESHFDESIHISELCDVAGVSERSVRNACHAIHGTSPKRYLTRRRLEAVRHALEAARRERGVVTRIATDYGFFELGRFAVRYRSLFGEHPSDTLRDAAPRTATAA